VMMCSATLLRGPMRMVSCMIRIMRMEAHTIIKRTQEMKHHMEPVMGGMRIMQLTMRMGPRNRVALHIMTTPMTTI
ncbi:MAG: hypothetical protein AAFW68_07145, partial [Pseudomonadota bacterium]